MLNQRYQIAATETLHYLKGIKQEDIDKIPKKLLEILKNNEIEDYECKFDYTTPLDEIEMEEETRGMITMIALNCWCKNDEEKQKIINKLTENEKKYQEELRKKYDPDNIFNKSNDTNSNKLEQDKDKEEFEDTNEIIEENYPTKSKEENFLTRFINKIKSFFSK